MEEAAKRSTMPSSAFAVPLAADKVGKMKISLIGQQYANDATEAKSRSKKELMSEDVALTYTRN